MFFNPSRKILKSLSNIGSITLITFLLINIIRLQALGIWSVNLKKSLKNEIIIQNYIHRHDGKE